MASLARERGLPLNRRRLLLGLSFAPVVVGKEPERVLPSCFVCSVFLKYGITLLAPIFNERETPPFRNHSLNPLACQ